jgi:hypothetical protein
MNKLTINMKHVRRIAFFLGLLFLVIQAIPFAMAEWENNKKPLSGAEAPSNRGTTNALVGVSFSDPNMRTVVAGKGTILRATNGLKTTVRVYDDVKIPQITSPQPGQKVVSPRNPSDTICSVDSLAEHGEIAPNTDGGTLNPVAFINPTTINPSGRIAFNSQVDSSPRNQGVFVADADGTLTAIAIGCGGLGGSGDTTSTCGDSSPIGGHFGGFFFGTVFTPDINDAGDVLFFCDVNGGSSRRALFLYRAALGQIVKVAAIGDPSPIGGTFAAVGPGSLNNNGKVVFLASPVGTINSNIFMWDDGVVTKVAAIGDPAPGGGTFSLLGAESFGFADGTNIPVGPVPDINDSDQISFRPLVSGGITERGIIVRTGGVDQWYVKVPDPTPIGGTYFDMQAASINNAGQIAFFADYRPTPDTFNSGWFAGAPGSWRKVIVFFDPVDGGQCLGLAFSRNPMQTIDAAGNVVFWTNLDSNGGADRLALSLADGSLLIAARHGDPTPIGGTFGSMDAWPAVNGSAGTINAATPGAQGGALSAHMVFSRCPGGFQVTGTSSKIGPFEIDLPLTGKPGVECRNARGNHPYTIVFTFNNVITSVDQLATTCGAVKASMIDSSDPHRLLVSLTGVRCNEQDVTVTLTGVHDDQGNSLASASATMGLLIGDTNGDGVVDAADLHQTKLERGQDTTSDNFREDVNASGRVGASDVKLVRSKIGTMLPP